MRLLHNLWWWIRGHCVWHHADWWAEHHGKMCCVYREDLPDRYISKWEFWVKHSCVNGC